MMMASLDAEVGAALLAGPFEVGVSGGEVER
jgi:hypothetical protein